MIAVLVASPFLLLMIITFSITMQAKSLTKENDFETIRLKDIFFKRGYFLSSLYLIFIPLAILSFLIIIIYSERSEESYFFYIVILYFYFFKSISFKEKNIRVYFSNRRELMFFMFFLFIVLMR
jgi:hypothetical protein